MSAVVPGDAVARFDAWVDELLEPWRVDPTVARLMSTASLLGDFSVIWHLLGTARGVTSKQRSHEALVFAALIGAESLLVNQGVKRLFRRVRPTETGDPRFPVRRPSTTSFPSGHASAAFFAATVLTSWHGRRSAPVWFGMAAVVGSSRAFVRIHHASDVVGGALLGLGLGKLAVAALGRRPPR